MKPIAAALCAALLPSPLSALAQEHCREVGPTHPDYPDYNATRCFITIIASLDDVRVLGGDRTVSLSGSADHPIPQPCTNWSKVNNTAVWDIIRDSYHHHPHRHVRLTFDVRRNIIVEQEDGFLETRATACRGIVGASFAPDEE